LTCILSHLIPNHTRLIIAKNLRKGKDKPISELDMQMPLLNPELSRHKITSKFKTQSCFSALWFGMLHKPVNIRVDVGWVFARDHEATNFSISNWFQIPAPPEST